MHICHILNCFFNTIKSLNFISEYIVTFNGYYSTEERAKFMKNALVNVSTNWKEIPRDNPASGFPSDFSLVEVIS